MAYREIVESDSAKESRDNAALEYARTEDAWLAISWLVARNPEVGTPIAGDNTFRFHKQQGYSSTGQPVVSLFYTYDDTQVTIVSARFEAEQEEAPADASEIQKEIA